MAFLRLASGTCHGVALTAEDAGTTDSISRSKLGLDGEHVRMEGWLRKRGAGFKSQGKRGRLLGGTHGPR